MTAITDHLSQSTEIGFLLTDSLSEYYESIVNQVMLDVTEDVLSYVPKSIYYDNIEGRQSAQKSMTRNLNFMRASLLASINPLVSTDIPQINEFIQVQNQYKKATKEEQLGPILLDAILSLNKKLSHQLGLIVNAEQSSSILLRQASAQFIKNNQPNLDSSSTITVEWNLRKPFQINVFQEKKAVQPQIINLEIEWLYNQLSLVETNLLNEFNDRIEEAIDLIIEALSYDI
ncbi:uncharacterized protein BX663DRAFT_437981 [Cokeromyces recurvatus]|uniref:uncharacterized protein n=1 Tax=Cokeromyces recurvatus TaxID=90255 RepID=UPI002220E1CF|nr:uncharacterized protein BX663DRAFT_437981 [Cokeromyces recurvatus]KAI7901103.1 hypothetical protein BX663DRAFT_437981 [Cokeromyces recurvatus]